ncbi:hypothetical protein [Viridibacillus arvi]|uniref:hypothetical protein n=1 Tax=Viridibacillus arvi TaxID=263475 RepID=UPI0034CE9EC4
MSRSESSRKGMLKEVGIFMSGKKTVIALISVVIIAVILIVLSIQLFYKNHPTQGSKAYSLTPSTVQSIIISNSRY